MLFYYHRVFQIHQMIQDIQEFLNVCEMETCGRFIQEIQGSSCVFLPQLFSQLYPLCLTTWKSGGGLAKFYVFSTAVREGLLPLVIIGVLASLISVFYYLRIIVYMYMREPAREIEIAIENPALFLVLFFCLYGVIQLGIYPRNILVLINQAISSFF